MAITFDIRTEAQRSIHAGLGAADLALEAVREYVAEAQKRFEAAQKDAQKALSSAQRSVKDFDFQPRTLRTQTRSVVTARVDELAQDAKARRTTIEKRVAELQAEAQRFLTGNVETVTDTYEGLAKRGEDVVRKLRGKPATKQTVSNVRTTASKAKATATQAKKTTGQVKRTVKKSPARSSAKATGTAARKTTKSAAAAVSR